MYEAAQPTAARSQYRMVGQFTGLSGCGRLFRRDGARLRVDERSQPRNNKPWPTPVEPPQATVSHVYANSSSWAARSRSQVVHSVRFLRKRGMAALECR
jgi:hypothetical protein